MAMDPMFRGYNYAINGGKLIDDALSVFSDLNLANGFELEYSFPDNPLLDPPLLPFNPSFGNLVPSSVICHERRDLYSEDCDLNDATLNYISQILMEEDTEARKGVLEVSPEALQAAEKSFYEVLGEKYPPSLNHPHTSSLGQNAECPDKNCNGSYGECDNNGCNGSSDFRVPRGDYNFSEYRSCYKQNVPVDFTSQGSGLNIVDGFVDSSVSSPSVPANFSQINSVLQFSREADEASKFLPNDGCLFANLKSCALFANDEMEKTRNVDVVVEVGLRGKKNTYLEDVELDSGRSTKQSAVYTESTVRSDVFDMMLLCIREKGESAIREASHNEARKNGQQNDQLKGSNGGKGRGKKQGVKRDLVDLKALLTRCAQAVAADHRTTANELLMQIRLHSFPNGDSMQRLASYFADALEARLAGSGYQSRSAIVARRTQTLDILKAHCLFLAVCPYKKLSNHFSNKTIMNAAKKATKLHIVDFGTSYGFQWPSFIEQLSSRPGGSPKLRITGIDLPQPGFRPAERIEETGKRLANYAESFNVPFEFNAIAKKWETIQMEDIKINDDEVLIVNCMFQFRYLLDETVMLESPRDTVLKLIRKMNPDVFVHGITNGAYSVPFFLTRFREALSTFSMSFDSFENTLPRESPERMLVEKEILGREIMNVIACEGSERIERPETYKQWQVRNVRAGFRQLPLNKEIVRKAAEWVTSSGYHKDFLVEEDDQWLLQGWKGKIVFALSSWKPAL
ncbi:scarecrow-like protein 33 [Malania oleifera]|uniref:scarecrow-like protein 33 n=1 Tax=Malania oleifera TaxID=397392 RepID=UPI0025ADEEF0|nr:scarecrow-like protein 33 [Malania oleifera]